MPVVLSVNVVVAKNTAIIDSTNSRIDVSQAVLHHFIGLEPDFFFQHRPSSFAGEMQRLINFLFPLDGFFGPLSAHDIRRADLTKYILAGARRDVKHPIWQRGIARPENRFTLASSGRASGSSSIDVRDRCPSVPAVLDWNLCHERRRFLGPEYCHDPWSILRRRAHR